MLNVQTNVNIEALLQNFQVEELEERLENRWGGSSSTKSCTATVNSYTEVNPATGFVYSPSSTAGPNVPSDQNCPDTRWCTYTKPGGIYLGCSN